MVVVAILGAIVIFIALTKDSTNQSVVADLLVKQGQCRDQIPQAEAVGVRIERREGITDAYYDEPAWRALDHESKVRNALLYYCADMPTNGVYAVFIKSKQTESNLAHVVNGNYFDD